MTSSNKFVKLGCWFAIAMSVMAIVGTYSRGGFVGLIVVGLAFFILAKQKAATLWRRRSSFLEWRAFAPQDWKERMGTTESYEKDSSAQGRIEAWQTSWNLAADRTLGGGFGAIEQRSTFHKYRPSRKAEHVRAPHSIYFQVLGDHGFVGLFLYLAMIAAAIFNLLTVQARTQGVAEMAWANNLAQTLIISLAGFLMAGSFLSMAYYDVFFCACGVQRDVAPSRSREIGNLDPAADIEGGSPATGLVPAWRGRVCWRRSATPTRLKSSRRTRSAARSAPAARARRAPTDRATAECWRSTYCRSRANDAHRRDGSIPADLHAGIKMRVRLA